MDKMEIRWCVAIPVCGQDIKFPTKECMPHDRPSKCEELFITVQLSQPVERPVYFFFPPFLDFPSKPYIWEKYIREIITNNLKQLRDMGNLIKGLKVAAYVAEIIVAGSVVIELAEKYSGKFGKKKIATGEVKAVDAATENW